MKPPKVWTFFYGSFMNLAVLRRVGLTPEQWELATLGGFDITIRPLANLVRSDQHVVYGIVAPATHEELRRLYEHAEHDLGGRYLPEAVLVQTLDGKLRPALCYIAPEMEPRPADKAYLDRIVGPAKEYRFPDWYIVRLESFRV
jgi:hypothetical protein